MGGLLAFQSLIGARLSIFGRAEFPALPAHALLGLAAAAVLGWLGLSRIGGRTGKLLVAAVLLAPTAGFTALHYEYSIAAALVHAGAAALLIVTTAFAFRRNA